MKSSATTIRRSILAAVVFVVAAQSIPYGRNHANPPVVKEPVWDSSTTRILAKRACFNCHSHETQWPWYAQIAPASWLIYHDVIEGRSHVNFSSWEVVARAKFKRVIEEGDMPPIQYRLAHPEARLSSAEKQQLVEGLVKTATSNK